MRTDNLSASEYAELLKMLPKLRKVQDEVAANDYYQALVQHDAYVKALGLERTAWAQERRDRLTRSGLSSVYRQLPPVVRVLSSDKTAVPVPAVIDLSLISDRGAGPPAQAEPGLGEIPMEIDAASCDKRRPSDDKRNTCPVFEQLPPHKGLSPEKDGMRQHLHAQPTPREG